jgi:hypothetical protein
MLPRSAFSIKQFDRFGQATTPFAAAEVDSAVRVLGVGLGSEAWIIPADNNMRVGAPSADEIDDAFGCLALEGHDREPDDVGIVFGHEPLDGLPDPALNEQ